MSYIERQVHTLQNRRQNARKTVITNGYHVLAYTKV